MEAIELFAGAGGAALGLEAARPKDFPDGHPPRLAEVVGRQVVAADRLWEEEQ